MTQRYTAEFLKVKVQHMPVYRVQVWAGATEIRFDVRGSDSGLFLFFFVQSILN